MTDRKQSAGFKPDDKAQSKRFLDTARKVGADRESAERGDALIGKLAKQPPERRKPHK
jgi:hypothetical protein